MTDQASQQPQQRTFFGHPWGLANLFGIEVWERFSFYGMQAILIYYLYYSVARDGLGLPQATATSWAQSADPVGIIFAPVFAALWSKLGDRQPPRPSILRWACWALG